MIITVCGIPLALSQRASGDSLQKPGERQKKEWPAALSSWPMSTLFVRAFRRGRHISVVRPLMSTTSKIRLTRWHYQTCMPIYRWLDLAF